MSVPASSPVRASHARILIMLADGWQLWTARGIHRSTYLRQPDGTRYSEQLHYATVRALERRGWIGRGNPGPAGRQWPLTAQGHAQAEHERAHPRPSLRERISRASD